MVSLRAIGVLSCAKMMAAIYGAMGLIFVPIFLLAGVAGMMTGRGSGAMSGIAMVFLAILLPFCYAALGFIGGLLSAWIYNLFAGWVGGIQLDLRTETVPAQ